MQARDKNGRFISTKKGKTMSKTKFTYNTEADLVLALSGNELYGYKPAEKYDATKFNYPITVTLNKEKKTFCVKESAVKEEVKKEEVIYTSTSSSKKTPFYKKGWFWFAVAAAVVIVAAIVVYNVK